MVKTRATSTGVNSPFKALVGKALVGKALVGKACTALVFPRVIHRREVQKKCREMRCVLTFALVVGQTRACDVHNKRPHHGF